MHDKTNKFMVAYVKSGGDRKKAAEEAGLTSKAAEHSLSRHRMEITKWMAGEKLTLESVMQELQFRASTADNEMAAVAALKTLASLLQDLEGQGKRNDLEKLTRPQIIEIMRQIVKESDKDLNIVEGEVIGKPEGIAVAGTGGDGTGNSPAPGSAV
jgi:hypothetical protein